MTGQTEQKVSFTRDELRAMRGVFEQSPHNVKEADAAYKKVCDALGEETVLPKTWDDIDER